MIRLPSTTVSAPSFLALQRAPRRPQQLWGLRLFRGRVPLAVQQLDRPGRPSTGQRLPGQLARIDQRPAPPALRTLACPGPDPLCGRGPRPRSGPALSQRSALRPFPRRGRPRPRPARTGRLPGRARQQRIYRQSRGLPGACGREWQGGDFRCRRRRRAERRPGVDTSVVGSTQLQCLGRRAQGRPPCPYPRARHAGGPAPRPAPPRGCGPAAAAGRTGRRRAPGPRGSRPPRRACRDRPSRGRCTAGRARRAPGSRSTPARPRRRRPAAAARRRAGPRCGRPARRSRRADGPIPRR